MGTTRSNIPLRQSDKVGLSLLRFALLGGCFLAIACHASSSLQVEDASSSGSLEDAGGAGGRLEGSGGAGGALEGSGGDGATFGDSGEAGGTVSDSREVGVIVSDSGESYQTCRAWADCPDVKKGSVLYKQICIGPYDYTKCGPAIYIDGPPGPCTDDSQCSSWNVCRADPQLPFELYGPTGLICAPPCVDDSDCPPEDKCSTSDGHCRGRTCVECPSYFSCGSGVCVRPPCSKDTDCPGGYCVLGYCGVSLGTCRVACS